MRGLKFQLGQKPNVSTGELFKLFEAKQTMTYFRLVLGVALAIVLTLIAGDVSRSVAQNGAAAKALAPAKVKTVDGEIQGIVEHGVYVFKGVPYAAPPVGDLRWREPKPAAHWKGLKSADKFGNACLQPHGPLNEIRNEGYSEDCLYLNVWTPRVDQNAKLPVMVWIHGGAYIFGSGSMSGYDGSPLATKGAVFVNLNYRLGNLGFFAHPGLQKETPGLPANFGLLDQIAALKWVQQNIKRFGGDPGNVTIFGESAGSKSVVALFASPLARGLFEKGIAMSTYASPDATMKRAQTVAAKFAEAMNLDGANATATQLRAIPADQIEKSMTRRDLGIGPVPIAGDTVLPKSIQETFASSGEAAVPLIIGNTSDDSSVVSAFGIDPVEMLKRAGPGGVVLRALYPGVTDDKTLARQIIRDTVFTMPVRSIADMHSRIAMTWRYYFDYVAINDRQRLIYGTPHGGEITFLLGTGELVPIARRVFTDADWEFSRKANATFFEFARTGKPSCEGCPDWPNHNAKQDRTFIYNDTLSVQDNFMKSRLDAFIGAGQLIDRIIGGN